MKEHLSIMSRDKFWICTFFIQITISTPYTCKHWSSTWLSSSPLQQDSGKNNKHVCMFHFAPVCGAKAFDGQWGSPHGVSGLKSCISVLSVVDLKDSKRLGCSGSLKYSLNDFFKKKKARGYRECNCDQKRQQRNNGSIIHFIAINQFACTANDINPATFRTWSTHISLAKHSL